MSIGKKVFFLDKESLTIGVGVIKSYTADEKDNDYVNLKEVEIVSYVEGYLELDEVQNMETSNIYFEFHEFEKEYHKWIQNVNNGFIKIFNENIANLFTMKEEINIVDAYKKFKKIVFKKKKLPKKKKK